MLVRRRTSPLALLSGPTGDRKRSLRRRGRPGRRTRPMRIFSGCRSGYEPIKAHHRLHRSENRNGATQHEGRESDGRVRDESRSPCERQISFVATNRSSQSPPSVRRNLSTGYATRTFVRRRFWALAWAALGVAEAGRASRTFTRPNGAAPAGRSPAAPDVGSRPALMRQTRPPAPCPSARVTAV